MVMEGEGWKGGGNSGEIVGFELAYKNRSVLRPERSNCMLFHRV